MACQRERQAGGRQASGRQASGLLQANSMARELAAGTRACCRHASLLQASHAGLDRRHGVSMSSCMAKSMAGKPRGALGCHSVPARTLW